jgi:hypothetical protein
MRLMIRIPNRVYRHFRPEKKTMGVHTMES